MQGIAGCQRVYDASFLAAGVDGGYPCEPYCFERDFSGYRDSMDSF